MEGLGGFHRKTRLVVSQSFKDTKMAWLYAAVFVAALVVSYVLAPKPQSAPPPGISEINVTTAEEGREIPVLFGTRRLKGPNVVWYGDVRIVAIKKKGGKK